jgi:thioredoxin-related protein
MGEIVWGSDLANALEAARNSSKLLFIAFSNPGCKGCAKMDSDTFTADKVQDYLNDHFILVKFRSSANPEKYLRFKVIETPTYIILNVNGKEVKRIRGFLSSDDLIGALDSIRSL